MSDEQTLIDALGATARQLGWTLGRVESPPGRQGEAVVFLFTRNRSPYASSSRENAKARIAVVSRMLARQLTKEPPVILASEQPAPDPCPECAVGKHDNCDGTTWDFYVDEPALCPCAEAGHS